MSDGTGRAGSAFTRWRLDSFDQIAAEAVAPAIKLPTAAEVAQIESNAHDAGYAAGLAEGRMHAEAEATRIRALAGAFSDALAHLDKDISRDLVELALSVARQLVRQTLPAHPALVIAVVREAIAAMPPFTRPAQLVVHPDDAALVRDHLETELRELGWIVSSDPRVERGGCRVESGSADLDATLATRWDRIASALASDQAWLSGVDA